MKTIEHIGKYAIEYDEAERRYSVAAGALVISTHPTLADAELAAHRYTVVLESASQGRRRINNANS